MIFEDLREYFDTTNMHSALEELDSSKGAIAFYKRALIEESDCDKFNKGDLVFFFVNEGQSTKTFECFTANFRMQLNALFPGNDWQKPIYDLGNLKQGNNPGDSQALLKEVVSRLYGEYGVIPLILGGSDTVDNILFTELSKYHKALSVVEVSSQVPHLSLANHFLSEIILAKNTSLFQYTQLGYQQYLNNANAIRSLGELHFETLRLGTVKLDLQAMEPKFRNAHYANFRMDVLRSPELVASAAIRPNGMFTFELCQLIWYAAFSDRLKVAHISDVSFQHDGKMETANLAQLVWHFLDGYQDSVKENFNETKNFLKFTVLKDQMEWIFYKSKRTDRWWVEVNNNCENKIKILIPCTLDDYNSSLVGEIPDSWFRYVSKIN